MGTRSAASKISPTRSPARTDRSLFACLVLTDASHIVTAEALRGLQRLRSANAGVVLSLRSLEDVQPELRGALLGAVGCRMAFAGVTTWDGAPFAEVAETLTALAAAHPTAPVGEWRQSAMARRRRLVVAGSHTCARSSSFAS